MQRLYRIIWIYILVAIAQTIGADAKFCYTINKPSLVESKMAEAEKQERTEVAFPTLNEGNYSASSQAEKSDV